MTSRNSPEPFDQQPLEACSTIAACIAAKGVDPDSSWRAEAERAFAWFLGANDLGLKLADLATGSCRDGLHPDRANENRGADSLLSFWLALADMQRLRVGDRRAPDSQDHPHPDTIKTRRGTAHPSTNQGTEGK